MCAAMVISDLPKGAEPQDKTPETREPSLLITLPMLLDEHLTRRAARTLRERSSDA